MSLGGYLGLVAFPNVRAVFSLFFTLGRGVEMAIINSSREQCSAAFSFSDEDYFLALPGINRLFDYFLAMTHAAHMSAFAEFTDHNLEHRGAAYSVATLRIAYKYDH